MDTVTKEEPPIVSEASVQEHPTILTAGFSNVSLDRFFSNMHRHAVQVLVDVRSRPFAAYTPHFNKDQITASAKAVGMSYLYLGRELGGMPDNPGFYDDEGYVLYDRVARTPEFQVGIRRLLDGLARGYRPALVCGEENPRQCHRRLLVGRVLREQGVALAHILADGTLISEAELLDEEREAAKQFSLFGNAPLAPWRSVRIVKPRRATGVSA